MPKIAIAQSQSNDPLAVNRQDPLIPLGYGTRELTSFEKYRIDREIANLDETASLALQQNNIQQAKKLWYRQLRLARSLGKSAEILALGNVGEVARKENWSQDVRQIAKRLHNIETEIATEKASIDSYSYERQLAKAYQQVGYLDRAINIYQQIITKDKHNADRDHVRKLGQLYLAVFDYPQAAKIYCSLIHRDTNKTKQADLQTLADIYDRTGEFSKAIGIRELLIQQYIAQGKIKQIPALTIANARNYLALEQTNKAISAYNRAFKTASKTQQLAIANDALQNIGKLYQAQNNLVDAIAIYQQLISIQQQSDNYYGLLDTYDMLGQIYSQLNQSDRAGQYFQQGLDLARSLKYKVKYFEGKIK